MRLKFLYDLVGENARSDEPVAESVLVSVPVLLLVNIPSLLTKEQ